jgi:hypothetical protein
MVFLRRGAVAAVTVFFCAVVLAAAPPPVGFASNEANFAVGSGWVQRHATLFDGDQVRSLHFATRVNLKDGSRYVLGIASQGTVRQGRLVLSSGSAELINAGQLEVSSLVVSPEAGPATATVYLTGKDRVSVLVRTGQVKVSRQRGASLATLRAGEMASWKPGPRGAIQKDSDETLMEVARVQSEQLSELAAATKNFSCLSTRVETLSNSYASLATQLAANQAARGAIQNRIESGSATAGDQHQLGLLNKNLLTLQRSAGGLGKDLNEVFLHHVPPQHSPHTVHGHTIPNPHEHHGEHGHTAGPSGGHHHIPPHQST